MAKKPERRKKTSTPSGNPQATHRIDIMFNDKGDRIVGMGWFKVATDAATQQPVVIPLDVTYASLGLQPLSKAVTVFSIQIRDTLAETLYNFMCQSLSMESRKTHASSPGNSKGGALVSGAVVPFPDGLGQLLGNLMGHPEGGMVENDDENENENENEEIPESEDPIEPDETLDMPSSQGPNSESNQPIKPPNQPPGQSPEPDAPSA